MKKNHPIQATKVINYICQSSKVILLKIMSQLTKNSLPLAAAFWPGAEAGYSLAEACLACSASRSSSQVCLALPSPPHPASPHVPAGGIWRYILPWPQQLTSFLKGKCDSYILMQHIANSVRYKLSILLLLSLTLFT